MEIQKAPSAIKRQTTKIHSLTTIPSHCTFSAGRPERTKINAQVILEGRAIDKGQCVKNWGSGVELKFSLTSMKNILPSL
jgi:hypothetical protein